MTVDERPAGRPVAEARVRLSRRAPGVLPAVSPPANRSDAQVRPCHGILFAVVARPAPRVGTREPLICFPPVSPSST